MELIDKPSLRKMMSSRKNCRLCLGKGYVMLITPNLDAKLFRMIVPCSCVRQLVRIKDD